MPAEVRTRKRKLPGPRHVGTRTTLFPPGSTPQVFIYVPFTSVGRQMTVSEGHDWPPPSKGKLVDRGGDFFTQRRYVASPKVLPWVELQAPFNVTGIQKYSGTISPLHPNFTSLSDTDWPPSGELSNSQLDAFGATAIKRCKPGDPIISLSTSIGELFKDGLPSILGQSLWRSRTLDAVRKNSAGEFLNYTFGYKPIVDDMLKFSKIVQNTDHALSQYERDAGRVVRRGYSFPIEKTSAESDYRTNVYPIFFDTVAGFGDSTGPLSMLGKVVKRRDTFRRIWFSGAFTYYLPSDYSSRNRIKELAAKADHLFGLTITPETLWNLAPWSWLTDWAFSTGDVISNLNSFKTNGLVMRYGYVMCHSITTDTYTHVGNYPSSDRKPRVPSFVVVTETKQRRAANPFGFGLTWNGLSPSQLAIAAALGINRK